MKKQVNKCKKYYKDCHVWCCKYIKVAKIGELTADTYKLMGYHNVRIIDHNFYIPAKCKHLKYNKCQIYNERPEDCKNFECLLIKELK